MICFWKEWINGMRNRFNKTFKAFIGIVQKGYMVTVDIYISFFIEFVIRILQTEF